MNCPLPSRNQIVTSGGHQLPCREKANVLAEIPATDESGNNVLQPAMVCVGHACEIAAWKLAYVLAEVDRRREKERRIVTL